jgi:hypothetical protein
MFVDVKVCWGSLESGVDWTEESMSCWHPKRCVIEFSCHYLELVKGYCFSARDLF